MNFQLFFDGYRKMILEESLESLEVTSGAIFSSLLLGDGLEMAPTVLNKIKVTGMLYFFVISGFHFSMLRSYFDRIVSLFRLPYKVRVVVVLLALFFFAGVVGFSIPIIRTLCMYSYVSLGKLLHRAVNNQIIFSVMVIAVCMLSPFQESPTALSVSFLLSFGAVFALIFLTPKGTNQSIQNTILHQCTVSLFVNAVIAPLLLYFFGVWNPVSIIFSVVFSPLIGALVSSGFLILAWQAGLEWLFPFELGVSLALASLFTLLVRGFSVLLEFAEMLSVELHATLSLHSLLIYYLALLLFLLSRAILKNTHESIFL